MPREIHLFSLTPYSDDAVHHHALLKQLFIPFIPLKHSVAVITSKIALHSMHYYYPEKKFTVITVGKKSKALAQSYGYTVLEHTTSDVLALQKLLQRHYRHHQLCYYRAREVSTELMPLLKNKGIDIAQRIVYETHCNQRHVTIAKDAILLFTSPKLVHCYFKHNNCQKEQKTIAIGRTTQHALQDHCNKVLVAPSASVEALVNMAKTINFES